MYNEFETKALGKLKILANIDNRALLEKMYDTPEKYIVATNFNIESKEWDFGSYFQDFQEALEEFSERVLNFRNLKSSKQKENTQLLIQFINEKPPVEERNIELYYYDLRCADMGDGYTIENNVLVNNIGSLVTNQDILKGKEYITNEELEDLQYVEVNYLCNEIEDEIEM